jgi:hypothetical protein
MFGIATAGAFGAITFTFTNGGFELAQARACCFVSKNLSTTMVLRSLGVRNAPVAELTGGGFVLSAVTIRVPSAFGSVNGHAREQRIVSIITVRRTHRPEQKNNYEWFHHYVR